MFVGITLALIVVQEPTQPMVLGQPRSLADAAVNSPYASAQSVISQQPVMMPTQTQSGTLPPGRRGPVSISARPTNVPGTVVQQQPGGQSVNGMSPPRATGSLNPSTVSPNASNLIQGNQRNPSAVSPQMISEPAPLPSLSAMGTVRPAFPNQPSQQSTQPSMAPMDYRQNGNVPNPQSRDALTLRDRLNPLRAFTPSKRSVASEVPSPPATDSFERRPLLQLGQLIRSTGRQVLGVQPAPSTSKASPARAIEIKLQSLDYLTRFQVQDHPEIIEILLASLEEPEAVVRQAALNQLATLTSVTPGESAKRLTSAQFDQIHRKMLDYMLRLSATGDLYESNLDNRAKGLALLSKIPNESERSAQPSVIASRPTAPSTAPGLSTAQQLTQSIGAPTLPATATPTLSRSPGVPLNKSVTPVMPQSVPVGQTPPARVEETPPRTPDSGRQENSGSNRPARFDERRFFPNWDRPKQ